MKHCEEWFTHHPHEHNMTYFSHLKRAWGLAFSMGKGCAALFIHGIFPSWFQSTGTQTIQSLYYETIPKSPVPTQVTSPFSEPVSPLNRKIPPLETS